MVRTSNAASCRFHENAWMSRGKRFEGSDEPWPVVRHPDCSPRLRRCSSMTGRFPQALAQQRVTKFRKRLLTDRIVEWAIAIVRHWAHARRTADCGRVAG